MLETYGEIFDLENEVRRFIVQKLSETYGRDWVKHQIPGEMYDEWKKRRDRAVKDGEVAGPLINYADFGDYVRIILRRDNWENVFKSYFHSKESVQESFRRIHPVRRSTMHSRVITIDLRLFLDVEVRRIRLAIDRKNSGMC
jgi:hypothetical protein